MTKTSWNDHACDEKRRRKSWQKQPNMGTINSYQISESICSFFTHPESSNEMEWLAGKENLLRLAGDQDLPSHHLRANEPGRAWHHLRELLHSCIRSGRLDYAQHSHGHRLNAGCCSLQTEGNQQEAMNFQTILKTQSHQVSFWPWGYYDSNPHSSFQSLRKQVSESPPWEHLCSLE